MSEMGSQSDAVLVRRILAGEVELYQVLVERYRLEFGRYATAMLGGDVDDAADAQQEAFIRAYRSLASCREPEKFKAWLFRIVSNQCHNTRRGRRKHVRLDRVQDPPDESTQRQLEANEIGQAIQTALDDLTTEQREAFVLKHVEGYSYAEMAALLEVGEDALKMRVHRARDELQRRLEGLR
ncbi:MAG: RNA polymerase sigma factor [Gemmatimonadota bacterium]|nr:MAG: RNA polymerase sigma factor [Gemmatimonadota bacterium]